MNKARREALSKVVSEIEGLRVALEELKDQESEYFDNMPESLQSGDKGQVAEEAVAQMEEALDALDTALDCINSAAG